MNTPDIEIRAWLEPQLEPYLEDLAVLVNRDCGTYYKKGVDGVIDWLEARTKALGATVERRHEQIYGDMLLARWKGKGKGRILLSGHADTVYPVGTALKRQMQRANNDPHHLLGPGVADMKSGLLAGLYAIAALRALKLDEWEEVGMIINSEEEIGSPVSCHWLTELSNQYDVALILEAARSNGNLVTGRKGGGVWWFTALGRAAHAGIEPEKGANAIIQITHLALALEAINGTIPGATLVVGRITGGEAANMVPPKAGIAVDGRALDSEGLNALEEAIQVALAATEGMIPGTSITVKGGIQQGPMARTTAILRIFNLAQESAQAQGFTIGEEISGGMSDGNYLAASGIPVLDGLGPVGGKDHSPDEYLRLESIIPRTAMLAGLIHRLSS